MKRTVDAINYYKAHREGFSYQSRMELIDQMEMMLPMGAVAQAFKAYAPEYEHDYQAYINIWAPAHR